MCGPPRPVALHTPHFYSSDFSLGCTRSERSYTDQGIIMVWYNSNVIRCGWSQGDDGWHLWVKACPRVCGDGETFEEAEEDLLESIFEAAPDPDEILPAQPQYDPPLPASPALRSLLEPELYLLWGGAAAYGPGSYRKPADTYMDSLFERGMCPVCRHGRGSRTSVPLRVEHGGSADLLHWSSTGRYIPHLFSENFIAHLRPGERRLLKLRPVEFSSKRRRKKYFEPTAEPSIKFAGIKGSDVKGSECPQCGYRDIYGVLDLELNGPPTYLYSFICRSDLPEPLPSMFLVGVQHNIHICVRRNRLDQLQSGDGVRGLSSRRLGIVDAQRCVPHPRLALHLLKEGCSLCARWKAPVEKSGGSQLVFQLKEANWHDRSWKWIEPAAAKKNIRIQRQTRPLKDIIYSARKRDVKKPDFLSFRCPNCWRLGYLTLDSKELSFLW